MGSRCSCGAGSCSTGKHPRSAGWQKLATADPKQVTRWWSAEPLANIGLATGQASGLAVLDIDGLEGEEVVARLSPGELATPTVLTGRGRQLYFRHPGWPVPNKVAAFPKLDSRGDGGYVVAPGSLHPNGKTYTWAPGLSPTEVTLEPAPAWWLEALQGGSKGAPRGVKTGVQTAPEGVPGENRGSPKITAKKGERNITLARLAGVLRDKGLSIKIIRDALIETNSNFEEPLSEKEVLDTVASYGRYMQGDPNKKLTISQLTNKLLTARAFISSPVDTSGSGAHLYIYESGHFTLNGASVAKNMTDQLLGQAARPDTINQVVELLKLRSKVDDARLNPRGEELIGVKNGMLNWRTGELVPHSPDHLSTFQLQAGWHPGARSELLDRFLQEVLPPDALNLMEEIIGYLLLPTAKYQKAFMLIGEGANGKGTLLNLITELLGPQWVSHQSLHTLEDSTFAPAELQGKLANINFDLPSIQLERSDNFKSLVAGDRITAERKYQHPFTFRSRARLLFSANAMPKSSDRSFAFYRRWVIIPFPNTFTGEKDDPELEGKLTQPAVIDALLVRAVAGLRRLESQKKFTTCKSVEEKLEEYQIENDSTYEFVVESLQDANSKSWVPKIQAWERYLQWCAQRGLKFPANQRQLNKTIGRKLNCIEERKGLERQHCWVGIQWVGEEPKKAQF